MSERLEKGKGESSGVSTKTNVDKPPQRGDPACTPGLGRKGGRERAGPLNGKSRQEVRLPHAAERKSRVRKQECVQSDSRKSFGEKGNQTQKKDKKIDY